MNPRELIETAAMDTLGLLTAEEREAFETALRAAPPHVQAEVRREQLRTAHAEQANLPAIEPPAWLRFKVLSAVRDAIARAAPADPAQSRRSLLPFAAFWTSTAAWRVAAIGLASATVTLGIFNFAFQAEAERLRLNQENLGSLADLQTLGQKFPNVVLADDKRDTTLAINPDLAPGNLDTNRPAPRAVCMASDAASSVVLLVQHLPVAGANYRVVLLSENGEQHQPVRAFTATGTHQGMALNIDPADTHRIAIVGPTAAGGIPQLILAARFA